MGYDLQRFPDPPPSILICTICQEVLEDPLVVSPCEHLYCRSCIAQWMNRSPTCPEDRKFIAKDSLQDPPRYLRRMLAELKILCDQEGCTTVVTVEELPQHLEQCRQPSSPCLLGCDQLIDFKDLASHDCFQHLKKVVVEQRLEIMVMKSAKASLEASVQELESKVRDLKVEFTEYRRHRRNRRRRAEQPSVPTMTRSESREITSNSTPLPSAPLERSSSESSPPDPASVTSSPASSRSRRRHAKSSQPNRQTSALSTQSSADSSSSDVQQWSDSLLDLTIHANDIKTWYRVIEKPSDSRQLEMINIELRKKLMKYGCPRAAVEPFIQNAYEDKWPKEFRGNYVCRRLYRGGIMSFSVIRLVLPWDNPEKQSDPETRIPEPGILIVGKTMTLSGTVPRLGGLHMSKEEKKLKRTSRESPVI